MRRRAAFRRPLHPPRRIHFVRRDGGGVFSVPLSPELLAHHKPGYSCRALLLPLALHLGRWSRPVEPGCEEGALRSIMIPLWRRLPVVLRAVLTGSVLGAL